MRKNHVFTFLALAFAEGLLAVWMTVRIPTDAKNIWLFGLSRSRLLLVGGLVAILILIIGAMVQFLRNEAWAKKALDRANILYNDERTFARNFIALTAAASISTYAAVNAFQTANKVLQPSLIRISPYFLWLALLAWQALIFLTITLIPKIFNRTKTPAFRNLLVLLAGVTIIAATWNVRVYGLNEYVTTDENLWAAWSGNFYYALATQDLPNTYQREHPGVTTMWAGAAAFFTQFPDYAEYAEGMVGDGEYKLLVEERGLGKINLLAGGRFFMVLVNTAAIAAALYYAHSLFGPLVALVGITLVAFDPFNVAHTRLLHQDGMLGSMLFLSAISFISYLNEPKKSTLFVSGAAAGLAWLTKSPGIFIIPFVGLAAAWHFILVSRKPDGKMDTRKLVFSTVKTVFMWGMIGTAVFIALFPAMWVAPVETVQNIVGEALKYAAEGHRGIVFFNGEMVEDGNMGMLGFSHFYPVTFLWRTTPVVFFGLILAGIGAITKVSPWDDDEKRRSFAQLLLFAIVFYLLMNIGGKRADRYLIPVYPVFDLIAGAGVIGGLRLTLSRVSISRKDIIISSALGVILLVQILGTLPHYPYFLSYYNPVLGGAKKAPEVMTIGWGEGLEQAAAYLLKKDLPPDSTVITWYGGSFEYFFDRDAEEFEIARDAAPSDINDILALDYAVVYVQQWQRRRPSLLLEMLKNVEPEFVFSFQGVEYVRVYDLSEVRARE